MAHPKIHRFMKKLSVASFEGGTINAKDDITIVVPKSTQLRGVTTEMLAFLERYALYNHNLVIQARTTVVSLTLTLMCKTSVEDIVRSEINRRQQDKVRTAALKHRMDVLQQLNDFIPHTNIYKNIQAFNDLPNDVDMAAVLSPTTNGPLSPELALYLEGLIYDHANYVVKVYIDDRDQLCARLLNTDNTRVVFDASYIV